MKEVMDAAQEKMGKAIDVAKNDFSTIRTGRASAALFSNIHVDYYGAMTPLQQLASISLPDARTVIVSPYDRASLGDIEKAIRDSDLGVNPTDDGTVLRISMPPLTEERRRDYIKLAKGKAEDARVSVRNVRRRAKDDIDRLVKDGEAGEDEGSRAEKELDALTKRYVDSIDELLKHKESELLEV